MNIRFSPGVLAGRTKKTQNMVNIKLKQGQSKTGATTSSIQIIPAEVGLSLSYFGRTKKVPNKFKHISGIMIMVLSAAHTRPTGKSQPPKRELAIPNNKGPSLSSGARLSLGEGFESAAVWHL